MTEVYLPQYQINEEVPGLNINLIDGSDPKYLKDLRYNLNVFKRLMYFIGLSTLSINSYESNDTVTTNSLPNADGSLTRDLATTAVIQPAMKFSFEERLPLIPYSARWDDVVISCDKDIIDQRIYLRRSNAGGTREWENELDNSLRNTLLKVTSKKIQNTLITNFLPPYLPAHILPIGMILGQNEYSALPVSAFIQGLYNITLYLNNQISTPETPHRPSIYPIFPVDHFAITLMTLATKRLVSSK